MMDNFMVMDYTIMQKIQIPKKDGFFIRKKVKAMVLMLEINLIALQKVLKKNTVLIHQLLHKSHMISLGMSLWTKLTTRNNLNVIGDKKFFTIQTSKV